MIIRLIVVVGGAVLMSLELVGSRVLAPHFGNSIFVWGSLIGVFLGALSAGYYAGGRLADRYPSVSVLSGMLAASGVMVFVLPFYADAVNVALVDAQLGPRAGPLLSATLLFAVPSILLGTVSPYSVKLAAQSLERVGNLAGSLYALSTAGSIAGTLGTAFFLIPGFGVATILRSLGLVLLVLAAAGWAASRPVAAAAAAIVALALVPVVTGATTVGPADVLFSQDTLYHHVEVVDVGDSRFLKFDASYQSGMYLNDPVKPRFLYAEYMNLAFVLNPIARHVLLVGLGGGSIPKSLLQRFPNMNVDAVEIDPVVAEVARRYFYLPDDPRLNVIVEDGRQWVQHTSQEYDVVMLDAYYADAIPFHLTTQQFLQEVSARLKPGGVVAANIIGAIDGSGSSLLRSMVRTFQSVYPEVYVVPTETVTGGRVGNVIVLAVNTPLKLDADSFIARGEEAHRKGFAVPNIADYARALYDGPIDVSDVPVLTDDYAPVDALLHIR